MTESVQMNGEEFIICSDTVSFDTKKNDTFTIMCFCDGCGNALKINDIYSRTGDLTHLDNDAWYDISFKKCECRVDKES